MHHLFRNRLITVKTIGFVAVVWAGSNSKASKYKFHRQLFHFEIFAGKTPAFF